MSRVDSLLTEVEWRKCRGSGPLDLGACVYFLERYWHIKHPEQGAILLKLRPAQRETLEQFFANRHNMILKARQIGFTTLVMAYAFWLAFFHADKTCLVLSQNERLAIYNLGMAKFGHRFLPDWMKDRMPLLNDHAQKMSFANESLLWSLPSAKDPARGLTAYLVIVDEWASLENPEEAWASIEPVADIGGRIIGLSTAKGWGNHFHMMWIGAASGENLFNPIFYPWTAVPGRDANWYEAVKRSNAGTPWLVYQEYPNDPHEAFVKSGANVFDVDFLMTLGMQRPDRGELHLADDAYPLGPFGYREEEGGNLRVWEFPDPMSAYVIGADTAEGLEWGDYSSAHVIDARTGLVVAHWHGHIPADQFGETLWRLGHWYNKALLGVENNNHGLTTCTVLQRARYPNLYYSLTYGQNMQRQTKRVGWMTTPSTKAVMIDDLARGLREGLLILWDEPTRQELMTYVRDPATAKMKGSPFDDRVMSLAVANQMLKSAFVPDVVPESNDYWSMDWWSRQLDDEAAGDGALVIGRRSRTYT